jgi:hypothetical protein
VSRKNEVIRGRSYWMLRKHDLFHNRSGQVQPFRIVVYLLPSYIGLGWDMDKGIEVGLGRGLIKRGEKVTGGGIATGVKCVMRGIYGG